MKGKSWVLVILSHHVLLHNVHGLQVFLQSLNVHVVHRIKPLEGHLDVFFQCDGGDRIHLTDVQQQNTDYRWPSEDRPLTTLSRGGCKHCAFFEDRKLPLVPDDPIGDAFQLCTADFEQSIEEHVVRQGQPVSFEAEFYCGECAPLASPPPPSPAPPPPFSQPQPLDPTADNALLSTNAEGFSVKDGAQPHPRGLGLLAILGIAISSASIISCVAAAAGMSILRYYRRKWADQRAREFEAVFSDPDLDFEEVVAHDAKSSNGWGWMQPNTFARLRDTQVSKLYEES